MEQQDRQYWLLKSEPEAYSIEDLAQAGRDVWDGVRNYQARNNLRNMQVGDLCFFYHSRVKPPAIVGLCKVSKPAHTDPTAFDKDEKYFDPKSNPENPRWVQVEVEYLETFPSAVSLTELKSDPHLKDMVVTQKGSRLSVQPVSQQEFSHILGLAQSSFQL